MEKNSKMFAYSIIITTIILSFIVFFTFKNSVSTSPKRFEECNLFKEGNGGIDVLFFSDEETSTKYTDYFLEASPFAENEDSFNFFYIANYTPDCELYNGNVLYCYSKDLVRKSASCPHDYIVVFEDRPTSIRSSAYMNVMSINLNHPMSVFLHEWGHVFGNLAEEYVDQNAKIPSGAKNCIGACSEFELETSCYGGCTKSDYLRSFPEGVMRTLSTNLYGPYDEFLLLERIKEEEFQKEVSITGKVIEERCLEKEYILMKLDKDNNMEIDSYGLGCVGSSGYGDTIYEILDFEGNTIFSQSFNKDLIFTTELKENNDILGGTYEYDGDIYFKIPKTTKAEKVVLKTSNGEIISKADIQLKLSDPCRIQ